MPRPSKNPALGQLLREARQAKGLTLVQLQELTGIEQSSIFYLERGTFAKPDPAKLVKLARALDIEVEELYDVVGYAVPKAKDLPEFGVYLRAKYDLEPSEIRELKARLAQLRVPRSETKQNRKAKP